ncbi:hypothetical protein OG21DRAFT_416945 [Imleria badia]|nr:hypothetical protein OG21DRAFT_416945 [Imleria badia]
MYIGIEHLCRSRRSLCPSNHIPQRLLKVVMLHRNEGLLPLCQFPHSEELLECLGHCPLSQAVANHLILA